MSKHLKKAKCGSWLCLYFGFLILVDSVGLLKKSVLAALSSQVKRMLIIQDKAKVELVVM